MDSKYAELKDIEAQTAAGAGASSSAADAEADADAEALVEDAASHSRLHLPHDGDRKAHTATASSSFVFARFGILSPSQASLNAIAIALNILSSVGIVLANKWVFAREGFSFGTLLTVIHFVVTFVGLEICARYGLFVRKRIPVRQVAGLCLVFSAFVVLTNLSLQYNSVGFYQMAKVLTTPFIVVVQTIFYGMSFSLRVKAALTVTCVGVGISSASDVQVNVLGTVFALAGVAAAGLYQIWVGTRQKELGVDSFQLLYYQAPISAMMLLFLVPVLDDMGKLSKFEWTASAITSILISASLAFFVNLSTFLIIGKTSAVTYNVVGHFKLCVVVILGFIIFLDTLVWKNALGIVIALVGVFWYSYIKLNNQA